jgi:predicted DNA-binding protein (MmcQ/YjbR family)
MTSAEFRELALNLPEAQEKEHMGHPDFRVRNKIFATLGPNEEWGMVKLTPNQQAVFVKTEPKVFQPIKGACSRACPTRL